MKALSSLGLGSSLRLGKEGLGVAGGGLSERLFDGFCFFFSGDFRCSALRPFIMFDAF